jgi:putative phosphoserine phosphatase/1-acylglycerol-3-phosphate O-acyltransferase
MAGRHGSRTLGQCGCPARSPKSKQAHQGPRSAFFDLDGTLVAGFTGVLLTQDTFRRREIGIGEFLRVVQSALNHQLGRADFEDLVHKGASMLHSPLDNAAGMGWVFGRAKS